MPIGMSNEVTVIDSRKEKKTFINAYRTNDLGFPEILTQSFH